jgi:hypothetical protein
VGERKEISIAPGRAASMAALEAEACRSQALYLFVSGSNFLVELAGLRGFWRIVWRSLSSTLPTESLFISAIVTSSELH